MIILTGCFNLAHVHHPEAVLYTSSVTLDVMCGPQSHELFKIHSDVGVLVVCRNHQSRSWTHRWNFIPGRTYGSDRGCYHNKRGIHPISSRTRQIRPCRYLSSNRRRLVLRGLLQVGFRSLVSLHSCLVAEVSCRWLDPKYLKH